MESTAAIKKLKPELNYHQERSSYKVHWNLFVPETRPRPMCTPYASQNMWGLGESDRLFCKNGCFQGPGKYVQFFKLTPIRKIPYNKSMVQIILKMAFPVEMQTDSNGETFEMISAFMEVCPDHYLSPPIFGTPTVDPCSVPPTLVNDGLSPTPLGNWEVQITKDTFSNELARAITTLSLPDKPKPKRFKFNASRRPECLTDAGDKNLCVRWMTVKMPTVEMAHVYCVNIEMNIQRNTWGTNTLTKFHGSNMSNSLFSATFSDITIYCGDKEYPAHKVVLAEKSSVFAAMFSSPMKESLTGKLKIEDTSPEVVKEFLRFIYTGNVQNLERYASGLCLIAEKYDVQSLKLLSERVAFRTITVDNVLERYLLGLLLNSDTMVKACAVIMKGNKRKIWKNAKEFCKDCERLPGVFDIVFGNGSGDFDPSKPKQVCIL